LLPFAHGKKNSFEENGVTVVGSKEFIVTYDPALTPTVGSIDTPIRNLKAN